MSAAQKGERPAPARARIVETPGVCGGYPRIWNTRISVGLIVEAYRDVGSDLERTVKSFPQLTPEQVSAALAYYESHRERVDADIASNARALEGLQGG
jgi:uncharacterized protein (DUF433 family)